jgi:putative DNA primase/helicase
MQIAAVAGCEWPTMARNAALALSRGSDATSSVGVELLADIRAVFEQKRVSSISLADLLSELLADDEAPWRTWNRGREMNARQLGKRLREFAIPSRPVRFGNRVAKGFSVDQFTDAFARYLVDVSPDSKQDVTESLAAAPAFLD